MKNALITGAGSGIGRAAALALSAAGYRVGLGGRRPQPLSETANLIRQNGGTVWWQTLDIRDQHSVAAFIETAVEDTGKIDLLVNSAGTFEMRPFQETSPDFWEAMLDTNLNGVYRMTYAAWPYLEGGQVINIGSVAGLEPYPGNAAYCASKYGLTGLSGVLALEGKEKRIRVHLVQPGNTRTSLWEGIAPESVQDRMIEPAQVAEVVRWLALSPENVTYEHIVIRPGDDPWKGEG